MPFRLENTRIKWLYRKDVLRGLSSSFVLKRTTYKYKTILQKKKKHLHSICKELGPRDCDVRIRIFGAWKTSWVNIQDKDSEVL